MFSRPNAALGQLHPPAEVQSSWVSSHFSHQAGRGPGPPTWVTTVPRDPQLAPKTRGHWQVHGQTEEAASWRDVSPGHVGKSLHNLERRDRGTCLGVGVLSSSPTKPHQLCGWAVLYGVSQTDFIRHVSLMHLQLNTGISPLLQKPGSSPNRCEVGCRSLTFQGRLSGDRRLRLQTSLRLLMPRREMEGRSRWSAGRLSNPAWPRGQPSLGGTVELFLIHSKRISP